jgi:hypothetical protein
MAAFDLGQFAVHVSLFSPSFSPLLSPRLQLQNGLSETEGLGCFALAV